MSEIILRDYQSETKKAHLDSLERGIKRQLAVLFTGGGKTHLTCDIAIEKAGQGKKPLILVERKVLAEQWKKSLIKQEPNLRIGIEMNSNKGGKHDDIIIASLQTLGRKGKKRIKKFNPNEFDFCVTDESHRFPTDTGKRVLNYFGFGDQNFNDKNSLLGLTATAKRHDGVSLGTLYDDIIVNYDFIYGQNNGWATYFEWNDVTTGIDLSKVKRYGNKYVDKEYSKEIDINERNELIVKSYFDQMKGQSAITYTLDVKHAYHLRDIYRHHGATAEVIEAHTPEQERQEIFKGYERGEINQILNFGTLTEGFDAPNTKGIFLTREFGSAPEFVQTVGRGIRPSTDAHVDAMFDAETRKISIELSSKPRCVVFDFHDHDVREKNRQNVATLHGVNKKLANQNKKHFYKEVVEPLERAKKEHGIDVSKIENLDDIEAVVKNRKLEIKSLKLSPEVEQFTDRTWVDVGDGYEIIYGKENKALIIERDSAKGDLIDKEEWHLLEHDLKNDVTKRLQTFNSLSGAFKIADEYADSNKWFSKFKKKAEWHDKGVTEGQLRMLNKFFVYKNGHSKFKLLEEKYEDTHMKKVYWKPSGEILNRSMASTIINQFFNSK